MKTFYNLLTAGTLATLLLVSGCDKQQDDVSPTAAASVQDAGKVKVLDAPTIGCVSSTGASITLKVSAGVSGAPAGFSVQWMLKSDFDANKLAGGTGWPVSSDVVEGASFCKASFSGVPGSSTYNLTSLGTATVTIGDVLYDEVGASSPCENTPLKCGQEYVFRAFAHNDPRSGAAKSVFSANQVCATLSCSDSDDGCTYTQGYWKTHGPTDCVKGNNTNEWPKNAEMMNSEGVVVPTTVLTLGSRAYSEAELCSIFNTPARGNGLLVLAHQLIAAKLNIANGAADPDGVAASIAAADELIAGNVVPPVGSGALAPGATSSLTGILAAFNEGKTGPGHCD